jgi:hypothetical protein
VGSNPTSSAIFTCHHPGDRSVDIVGRHLSFVKEQATIQEKLARKFEEQPWRKNLHEESAAQFRSLVDDIVIAQRLINDAVDTVERSRTAVKNLSLTSEDLEGLPKELLKELNVTEADTQEFMLERIIETAGGILSLDKIIIAIFKETGKIEKRSAITSRIYRMIHKGIIFPVGNKKGIYSTHRLSKDDIERLFAAAIVEEVPTRVDQGL